MPNKMINGDKLLEWAKEQSYNVRDYHYTEDLQVFHLDWLTEKVKSLMSEAPQANIKKDYKLQQLLDWLKGRVDDLVFKTDSIHEENQCNEIDILDARIHENQDLINIIEAMNNPDFKGVEFDTFRKEAGLNSFTLTPKKWIENYQMESISGFPSILTNSIIPKTELEEKIQSLMPEPATDTNVATKPSDWQVGDRVYRKNMPNSIITIKNILHDEKFEYECPYSGNEAIGKYEKFHNIDAERRALQVEIDRLNSKIELEIDKGYELSIQIDNLNDEIEVLQRERDKLKGGISD